ncbi:iron-sulfur cluster assembly accessory protein [Haloterrigena turkmenica DSM 5511]|uniref:Iron-sulfur cluster assembly accessory protein n=1 Tax=Haloterrigena turkmenica (strain ATCC 51198 / DSM 5511 / JCM 9101 / NCIMB 13204 / VKM B-1734 / 4k) TaxID=543526 RepID=D2RSH6_HALTV|nr:iron-sulfur cluster assembly accessory protein [Haloterrigena turkmenica]ADB60752.1 iron-sulfur cluster assembly accessory protein [Haloterrigena turkmenica DSM 5511]
MSTDSMDGGETETRPEIEVTEDAAEQALSLLEGEGLDDGEAGLRLFVQQGGCAGLSYGMRFDDAPDEDDTIYEHHDLRVFVDPASLKYIEGSVLDYEDGLQAEGFHVENPNVVSECGCGESFRT